ncbi:hypothetical protein CPB83DRAFT_906662 [Crepidotus variabilis]|uniref:Uncharacterized protein n=1 Tax=Crepidotus variabilis TaxID=179855 RepID=A0A9P6JQJ4_9AGAR|nr:hypothetical protein CPB83DRAFT_906662 [Crepidotus variabilis]
MTTPKTTSLSEKLLAEESETTNSLLGPPRLPPEIISLVFESLAVSKDWSTLRTCGVLSSAQLHSARKYLFSTVSISLITQVNVVTFKDIARRIQGLTTLLRRDPETSKYVTNLVLLDSFPVYDSDWITQHPCLPTFLHLLPNVQSFTFGCAVGYLSWALISSDLRIALTSLCKNPHLRTLTFCSLGNVPINLFDSAVRYLTLTNTLVSKAIVGDFQPSDNQFQLRYLAFRSSSLTHTESAWNLMQNCAATLKYLKWRCWEDPVAQASTLPGPIDLGKLTSLKKLSVRLSFGRHGYDLRGFHTLLQNTTEPMPLRILDISISFPLHFQPHKDRDILQHSSWVDFPDVLKRKEYRELKKVKMEFVINRYAGRTASNEGDPVLMFKKAIMRSLVKLRNASSFHFKLSIRTFNAS